jgi:predicted PurR-regulated permease PerM
VGVSTHTPPSPARANLYDYFLIGLVILALAVVVDMLLPLSGAIMGALVIGTAFFPLHQRLCRRLHKWSRNAQALTTDFLVLLFLIVPSVLLIWIIVNEAKTLAPTMKGWQETFQELKDGRAMESIGGLRSVKEWSQQTLGISPAQFRREMVAVGNTLVERISVSGAALMKNFFAFVLNLLVMLLTLFFVFRDGDRMHKRFMSYIPLNDDLKDELSDRTQDTIVGVLRGWFLTSLAQGLAAGIGYLIVGAPAVALLSTLTAITGLIPSIGTALVWLPMAIYFLSTQDVFKGVFLMVWGILIVGLLDNFLRPYLVKGRAELPFLALFFAILGGIEAWGIKGAILGPLLIAVTPLLLNSYRNRYLTSRHQSAP